MRDLVLGLDAGGTKTDAMLADLEGRVLASVRTGPANHEKIGWSATRATLGETVALLFERAGASPTRLAAEVWGVAGLDWPEDETAYRAVAEALTPGSMVVVLNDAFLALESAERTLGDAVAVSAGTGVVAVGRAADGRTARTFGVGAGHGDWGSGGDVVMAAAQRVAEAALGIAPATGLTARALEVSGASSVHEYARLVWREASPALLPPDVWELAQAGDAAAESIAQRAADSYAAAAASVAGQLALTAPEVVLSGRVLDPGHAYLHECVLQALDRRLPGARPRRLGTPPVAGAIHAARRLVRDLVGSPGPCRADSAG